jgi:glucose/arabinose dehydrogenase/mono/diheme cytochrome c family protein
MRTLPTNRTLLHCLAGICLIGSMSSARGQSGTPNGKTASASCPDNNAGLTLPPGFCATIFANGIGHARHLVVAPDGVVYVNTWSGRYYGHEPPHPGGFLVALRDTTGSGKANVVERFGETAQQGDAGGTGIGLYKNWIYAEANDRIVRYELTAGSIVPRGSAQTVLSGLPLTGDHPMHPFLIGPQGWIYIDVATATNACQVRNRQLESPGRHPCTELETRGGIWRYNANELNQKFSPAARYATGIRNAEGFGMDSDGRIFITQQGRDQLHANWPKLYQPSQEATLPAEELMLLKSGGDYGWPYCYYDPVQQKLVLAPEYGGDGGKRVGICASKLAPVAAFPAHWAPNGMGLYNKEQFPSRYRGGVLIAFHGSWDRAPYPQSGYNVVFQPLHDGHASGACEVFADGFAGAIKTPGGALHRPSGVAVGPHGSLYVSDDIAGTIYRITYSGGSADANAAGPPCPPPNAPAGPVRGAAARPPEGTHANAGLPVPPGATRAMVALGDRIYHGQVGGATCTGCHGENGEGSPLGPKLTAHKWLWSDGSYDGIMRTIRNGVPHPKQYRSPMPAMGGAPLTPDQLKALTAYVWGLSR